MKSSRNAAVLLVLLLAACLFAYYSTRGSAIPEAARKAAAADQPLVDTSGLQEAVRLASFAATPDEQAQAREAWRLADHETDLKFAAALRAAEAASEAPVSPKLRPLAARVVELKSRVDAEKKKVDAMGDEDSEDADRARVQITLDQDELDDAQQDLAREGGDKRPRLQRLLQEHQASDKIADQGLKFSTVPPTGTLSEQLRAWLAMGDYDQQLDAAAQNATAQGRTLLAEHNRLEGQLPQQPDSSASIAKLRQLSGQRKELAGLDQRVQDSNQLAVVYQRWDGLVETRRRAMLHSLLRSLLWILGILLGAVLLHRVIRHAFRGTDRRRLHQLRTMTRVAIQVIAVLLILVVVFGPPTQISTVVGLITAGLTVVLKDFIVAFLGWFTLMGKNGISVGDWVEIEGVLGEVVDVGVFKTVLLELGDWSDSGHPTGRHVSFSNGFAMEGHYFNFSTAGQWLWDEIRVTVPAGDDPYETARRIREIVERETQENVEAAARDWERVTQHQHGAREISAKPAVDLRPASNGLEVAVRYIVRAPKRNATKSKLFQEIVEILRRTA